MKKNISFLVTGMHCASCEILIKDELSALTGVSDATVDFKTGKGSLILDLDKNSENDILLAIKKAGYTAVIDGASDSNLEKDNTEVIKKTIKPNEPFRVIFEEKYIGNKLIDIGRIKSAFFKHKNEKFYSFYFKQNGKDEYFDEKGNSLRRAFLKSPLKFGRMTSSYSKKRFHPVLHRFKSHLGTDYAAPTGTKIHSTGDGVVIDAKYNKNNGNYVKIRHNGTYMTQYLHMSKIADGIRPGVHVKQDQVIGYVGMTGLATGPHVCYRFWKNGEQVNSQTQKVVGSNPISKKNLVKYKAYVDSVKTILDEPNTVIKNTKSKTK